MSDLANWIAAVASVAAVVVSIVALATSMRRATQKETEQNIHAVQEQMRAFELEIAKKGYVTRDEIKDELGDLTSRIENMVRDLGEKVDRLNTDLTRFIRGERQP